MKDFYKNHTKKETEIHFNVKSYVLNLFMKNNNILNKSSISAERQKIINEKLTKKLSHLDENEVAKYYSEHSRIETANHFHLGEGELRSFLKLKGLQRKSPGFNGDPKTTERRLAKLQIFWNDKERLIASRKKAQDTMQELYGDPKHNVTKSKEANLEKYGVEYYMQSPDFKEKSKKTMLELYGVDNALKSPEILQKIIENNLARFEAVNALSSGSSSRAKRDKSMLELYGVIAPMQNQELKYKIQQTLLDRYNVPNAGLVNASSKQSKEELSLIEILEPFGFVNNDLTGILHDTPFFYRFSNGSFKCPDFFNLKDKVILEYNGSYWHTDRLEQDFWKQERSKLGYHVSVVWDFELEDFKKETFKNIEDLLSKFPCSYRTKTLFS